MENETSDFDNETSEKLTIALPLERVIDAAVDRIVGDGSYDSEGDYYAGPGDRFRKRIEEKVEARINKLVAEAFDGYLAETIRARVEPKIDAAIAEGFPRFNEYGEAIGTTTWAAVVQEGLARLLGKNERGYYGRDSWAVKAAKEAFNKHAAAAFAAEIETIRKRVREYVDEQLAGTVVKALREAVGLRG